MVSVPSTFSRGLYWRDGRLERSCYPSERLQCVLQSLSTNIALDNHLSYFGQAQSCNGRSLHVRSSSYPGKRMVISVELAELSWETLLTAGFELDVLRRKRPYRWTIWVSHFHHMGFHQLNELVVPWNPLHWLTWLHLLIHCHGRLRDSMSRKALAMLEFRTDHH